MAVKGALHITAALRGNTTYLKHCYYAQPFKVMNITEDKQALPLHLMLMSASPGVLDGDTYNIRIEVAEKASLQLHTQSYQRLFQMRDKAVQRLELHMEKDASFCFIPHPVVPHKNAVFAADNLLYLSKGCTLLWGEVLTCGRKLCDEVFHFSKYSSKTQIYLEGKLVVKENLLMQPSLVEVNAIGQMEGYTHQATFIYINEAASVTEKGDAINCLLEEKEGITYGVTALPLNGLLVRILGNKGEQLHTILNDMARHLQVGDAIIPGTAQMQTQVYPAYVN